MVDRDKRTALHLAAFENDATRVHALLDQGADPNAGDKLGFTPLHLAVQQGSFQAAQALLDRGAEVDLMNAYGNTPLFTAVFNSKGDGELIGLLRERGADPMVPNKSGQTPVGLARLIGNYDIAQFFRDLPLT